MTIDLSKIGPLDFNSGKYVDHYKEKSKVIFDKLYKLGNYNYLIIPIHIYNIISTDSRFIDTLKGVEVNNELRKVGEICGYECYVDMYMDPFEILLSYDKVKIRDSKIDCILSSSGVILKEKKVKIIS
jgi:hypothetical protein